MVNGGNVDVDNDNVKKGMVLSRVNLSTYDGFKIGDNTYPEKVLI